MNVYRQCTIYHELLCVGIGPCGLVSPAQVTVHFFVVAMYIVPHLCNRVLFALKEVGRVFTGMEHFIEREGVIREVSVDRLEKILSPLRDVLLETVICEIEQHRGGITQLDFFCRLMLDSVRKMQNLITECFEESLTISSESKAHASKILESMVEYMHCIEAHAKHVQKLSMQTRSLS